MSRLSSFYHSASSYSAPVNYQEPALTMADSQCLMSMCYLTDSMGEWPLRYSALCHSHLCKSVG